MLYKNLKIAIRSIARNSTFSGINILGLGLGISIFLLITEYIAFEWGANRMHKNYEELYRANIFTSGSNKGDYYIQPGLSSILKSRVPGIKNITRLAEGLGNGVVVLPSDFGSKPFTENKVSYTDGSFFNIFSFPLQAGNGSLSVAQTAAISSSTAKKYFGSNNAIGKTLTVKNQFGTTAFTVTTVFKDISEQSDINADIFLSLKTLENAAFRNGNDWADPATLNSGYTFQYFLLDKSADLSRVNAQATNIIRQIIPDNDKNKFDFKLQPLSNLHLAPSLNYPFQTFGSLVMVVSFLVVSLLIISIAWLNYINLSAAQALQRARDQGVRKILGASRWQIAGYHFTETVIITAISCAIAIGIVILSQPFYNRFLTKQLSLSVLNQGWFWPAIAATIFVGCVLTGGYISLLLSSADPLKVIKGKASIKVAGVSLRKGLVIFQFTISVVLIIATVTLYRQLSFMQSQNLGMNTQQLMVITGPSVINSEHKTTSAAFKNQLRQLPYVEKVAGSNNIPGQGYNFTAQSITGLNPMAGDEKKSYSMLIVDENYFDTYGITLASGRNFSADATGKGWTKAQKVILNQAAASQLGFKEPSDAVGQKIKWSSYYEVVGVVKDYHHLSLHQTIKPMIFLPATADGYFTLKMDTHNLQNHISQLKTIYEQTFPGEPFNYVFDDELFGKQYLAEQKLGSMFMASAAAAIFIASLGLFGLAAFAARQKIKEIGIRKVLGASVFNIAKLVSADFVILVIIAIVIASPIAWYLMNKWLQDFAYRINLQWWIFALSGGVALLIAFLTVSLQSVKAASANPVKSLKNE